MNLTAALDDLQIPADDARVWQILRSVVKALREDRRALQQELERLRAEVASLRPLADAERSRREAEALREERGRLEAVAQRLVQAREAAQPSAPPAKAKPGALSKKAQDRARRRKEVDTWFQAWTAALLALGIKGLDQPDDPHQSVADCALLVLDAAAHIYAQTGSPPRLRLIARVMEDWHEASLTRWCRHQGLPEAPRGASGPRPSDEEIARLRG